MIKIGRTEYVRLSALVFLGQSNNKNLFLIIHRSIPVDTENSESTSEALSSEELTADDVVSPDRNAIAESSETVGDVTTGSLKSLESKERPKWIDYRQFPFRSKVIVLRSTFILLSLLFEIPILYVMIGVLNKKLKLISSVFLCYAGSPKYAEYYAFKSTYGWLKWRPTPIGILKQGNKWGIVFGTPMTEKDFTSRANQKRFTSIMNRLEKISAWVGAEKISLAGVLPSYLQKQGKEIQGCDNTMPAMAVVESYLALSDKDFNGAPPPVILLGGNGDLGQEIQKILEVKGVAYWVVDPNGGSTKLPEMLRSKAVILIDVSRRNVLQTYVDDMWSDITILNETFPEPSKKLVSNLKSKGIRMYHLSGVEGNIFPSLPYGYENSVPCCAMHDVSSSIKPILMELSRPKLNSS